jgi:uncharacterized protein with von Willebrand factor type A (vWA) domain
MAGPKEVWSKAVALALMAIARRQGRDMMIIHFAATGQMKVDTFDKGHGSPSQIMDAITHFYNGPDTVFEPWMAAAIKATEKAKFAKADVICVSDGLASIKPSAVADFNRVRKEKQMRCFGILLQSEQGLGAFTNIADQMMTLENMQEDNPVLETIFAV